VSWAIYSELSSPVPLEVECSVSEPSSPVPLGLDRSAALPLEYSRDLRRFVLEVNSLADCTGQSGKEERGDAVVSSGSDGFCMSVVG
jgi:hypothetical protein